MDGEYDDTAYRMVRQVMQCWLLCAWTRTGWRRGGDGWLRLMQIPGAEFLGEKHLYNAVMAGSILEMIGMIRHILVIGFRTVLRTIFIAAALSDAAGACVEAA